MAENKRPEGGSTLFPGKITGQNLCLIGMAGAGKSVVGKALAKALGWAHVDTDRVIEAHFGMPLQEVLDAWGPEGFKPAEAQVIESLTLARCVISTGGSVVYSEKAMSRLKHLGKIIYLKAAPTDIEKRVENGRNRGLVRRPGQTLAELYAEREPLYQAAADFILDTRDLSVEQCVQEILAWLEQNP